VTDILSLDVESRSPVDLRKAGAHRYWRDPSTGLWCACYAFNEEPVQVWRPGEPCPPRIAAHIRAGGVCSGWNVGFEKLAWWNCLTPVHGWPRPELAQFEDTAAAAAAMALPRALGDASKALGLDVQKDDEGRRLMLQMSKPRRPRKGEDPDGVFWWDEPEKLERLIAYCRIDVEVERAIRHRLVPLSDSERDVYLMTERMNDRGWKVDVPLIRSMMRVVEQAQRQLDREMTQATGGYVTAASQVSKLTAWLQENGVPAESLAKAALEDLLALDDVPEQCRRALEIRKEAAKSSTAKLKATLECVCDDGRVRGLLLYHGASTGRWSAKLIQVQNYPRGSGVAKSPDRALKWMRRGDADLVRWLYDKPLSAVSDTLRATLTCEPGRVLMAADYSAIEGRVTAWLAGEEWELDAYRAADAGTGPEVYCVNAEGIFNRPINKKNNPYERQVGKVATLALGFAGGVNAFHAMALIYGTKMDPAFGPLWELADAETRDRAVSQYQQAVKNKTSAAEAMTREGWLAAELTKIGWRAKHPATVRTWYNLQDGSIQAVENPGAVVTVGKLKFLSARGFLWMMLPSGRCLAYGSPRVEMVTTPWGAKKPAVTALGVDPVTKQWRRFTLSPMILIENPVQAIARDVMSSGSLKAEVAGYMPVGLVHDEGVAEVAEGFGSLAEFERLLCATPGWAAGLPVVASGWTGRRYRKD
jgi:DNA polymerase